MIKLVKITKSYPQRGIVLEALDFDVTPGDLIVVTGPSGSGKTTLLNLIGLLDRPDSGDILFNGESILSYNHEESANYRNKNVGFVFQEHLLLPHLTISENILLPLMARHLSEQDYSDFLEYSGNLMESVGIAGLGEKYPFQVSGGEAQRAALVRALVNKPSLLLADEPTGALDSKNSENLGLLLLEMNRQFGISILLATHSTQLAATMERKYKLENGSLSAI
jgi:lipoprotein-releasing system ATP-binding protein